MGKKIIKKRSKTGDEVQDPELEEVGEERALELELDEEDDEIVMVCHYRRKWGDEFDSDTEHGFNIEEATQMIGVMLSMIDAIKMKKLIKKSTPELVEGNPMQGPRVADEKNNEEGK